MATGTASGRPCDRRSYRGRPGTVQRLRQLIAGMLVSACFLPGHVLAGAGGDPQVPNLPVGRFLQPGAPGLCQCIAVVQNIAMSCRASAGQCEQICASRLWAFVPDSTLGELPPSQPTS